MASIRPRIAFSSPLRGGTRVRSFPDDVRYGAVFGAEDQVASGAVVTHVSWFVNSIASFSIAVRVNVRGVANAPVNSCEELVSFYRVDVRLFL